MDDSLFPIICIGLPVAIIILIFVNAELKRRRIREAERVYNKWLNELRKSPSSSAIRESTLGAGREYARAASDAGKESLFSEVSLMNDINAIAGSSVAFVGEEKKLSHPVSSISFGPMAAEMPTSHEDRLRSLDETQGKRPHFRRRIYRKAKNDPRRDLDFGLSQGAAKGIQ